MAKTWQSAKENGKGKPKRVQSHCGLNGKLFISRMEY